MNPQFGFEVKFYGEEEVSFPAWAFLRDVIDYVESYHGVYPVLDKQVEGFNVRVNGVHVGTIKPAYISESSVSALHNMLW